MSVTLYEVGGCVRDDQLGVKTKDIDYTAVVSDFETWTDDPFKYLRDWLVSQGFEIFVESPQYLTLRARFPKDMTSYAGRSISNITADFVLARKESEYTDGRRPDKVEPGTLEDDLRRRDFTVNALAKDANGNIIDLFGGRKDLADRLLRCVGSPEDRFSEDALRALRAIRFAITKGMTLHESVADALRSEWLPPLLSTISVERRREELLKAFASDTLETLKMLQHYPALTEATFSGGLWLMPSLKGA